jgi:hypothetical protein
MTTSQPGSRTILRAAWRTLLDHPRLLWFPAITSLGALAVMAIGAALAWVSWVTPDSAGVLRRGVVVTGLLTACLLQMWSLISAVGLSRAAMEAMAGRPWSCRESVRHAMRRITAIAPVAVAQAGVGQLLGGKKNKKGKTGKGPGFIARMTTRWLQMAWWAATYLVVPVLAREGRGGLGSIIRSAKLFRQTWKEAFVGRLALGWLWGLMMIGSVIPIAACVWLGVRQGPALFLLIGLPLVVILASAVVLRTLDTIYRTALYVFATEGVVPDPFDTPDLHAVFFVRGR